LAAKTIFWNQGRYKVMHGDLIWVSPQHDTFSPAAMLPEVLTAWFPPLDGKGFCSVQESPNKNIPG
jgi:hypothetical protein